MDEILYASSAFFSFFLSRSRIQMNSRNDQIIKYRVNNL